MSENPSYTLAKALWRTTGLSSEQVEALFELYALLKEYPELRVGQAVVNATLKHRNFTCPEVYYIEDEDLAEGLESFRRTTL